MAARLSTGLVKKMMDTSPFRTLFAASFIDIYSGAQPASPDDAASGNKLVTIYSDGASVGVNFDTTAPVGVLPKAPGETWSGTVLATGVAGYFRLREAGDPGTGASTTAVRYDGAVATSGAEMNLGSLTLTIGAPFIISSAIFTLPKST